MYIKAYKYVYREKYNMSCSSSSFVLCSEGASHPHSPFVKIPRATTNDDGHCVK